MKAIIITLALIFNLSAMTEAATYYFSTTNGNDSRTPVQAQSSVTPWKTIAKLNSYFSSLQPGDMVLFCRGDVFPGSINIQKSGTAQQPITFADYGNAGSAKPVISGLTGISNWVSKGNGIWEGGCPSCRANENMVLLNGKPQAMGRYPNSNVGYLTFESHSGNTQITDNQLAATPNWTGAEMVIKPNRWVIDRDPISKHSGTTITYTSASTYTPSDNFGYFIQNSINTLDQAGEWYYNAGTKNMDVYSGNTAPAAVQASVADNLVTISGKSYINFNNLAFTGSNADAFVINSSQNISVTNCTIQNAGSNAISSSGSSNVKVENNLITGSYNMCFSFSGSYISIMNNTIKNIGSVTGMGKSGNNMYGGIVIFGNNNTVEANSMDSIGYNAISFTGNNVSIKNNLINHFTITKDDGGGIYTYAGAGSNAVGSGRVITGNIILNGFGGGAGTNSPDYNASEGIYMDDNSGYVEISNNTVANCGEYGIFLHNAHAITVTNNTLYNNNKQIGLKHDNICPSCYVQSNNVNNNVIVSKWVDQNVSDFMTVGNDIANFGTFDYNYYCRPFDDNLTLYTSSYPSGSKVSSNISLKTWQSAYSKDPNSKKSPVSFPYYSSDVAGINQFANCNFNTDINGLYSYSAAGNDRVSWDNSGKLDGGTLKFFYANSSGQTNISKAIIAAGSVTAGKKYVLKFSMLGSKNNQTMNVFLRQSQSPFSALTPKSVCQIGASRTENEFSFTPSVSESDMSIIFEMPEQDSTVWFDNIKLYEEVTPNKFTNGDFTYDVSGLYTYSALNNTKVEWGNNGKMDGGALKFSFTSNSGQTNISKIIIGAGSVTAGKSYVLRFSMLGTKNNTSLNTFLRQSQSPFNTLSTKSVCNISDIRTENEFTFSPTVNEADMSIIFEIPEQDSTIWLDNVQLLEGTSVVSNPDDYIRFEYNATPNSKTVTLNNSYIDVKSVAYSGSVALAPYSSVVLLKAGSTSKTQSPLKVEEAPKIIPTAEMNIYPNPVTDFLNISVANAEEADSHIEVFDITGARVISKEIRLDANENKFQVDVNDLKPGIYFLRIATGKEVIQKTFNKLQ